MPAPEVKIISPQAARVYPRGAKSVGLGGWHANGLYYGVGVEIDLWLHAGFDVVVNGSCAHLPQARARVINPALLPICLQVSPEILRQRLENRGRENASEINARLRAPPLYSLRMFTLNNDGSLRQSVDKLLTLIHRRRNAMPA